ncbi:MAG: Gfo/Idh/MocA family oxidoreductase [Candidatus Hydrogenedentes bacterium]|nr:Gfo/Idh/MocA family oxidoreductase [Candidatus Hydrogenedentota bacterium]
MSKKKLKVGLIGAGGIAKACHLPNWRELEQEGRVELVAVCDIIKERAEGNAAEFGGKPYLSYKKMLRDHKFDIVDVCTQNRHHARITVDALNAGAHVLVEKPMAMNSAECQAMIKAAKAKKRTLMVAQHMRFESANEKLKAVVDRGELGDIYTASAVYLRRRGIPGWGKFHIKRESLGGPLIDIGVHVMDLCMWLMGFPKPVAASGKVWKMFGDRKDLVNCWGNPYPPKEFDVEDYATAMVRFQNGAVMNVEVSWAANIADERHGVTVLGDKAGLGTNPLGVFGYQDGSLTSRKFDWMEKNEGHRMEIRHFTECLEKGLPVRVQPAESLLVQKVIDAIYESSKKNKEIAIR